MATTSDGDQEKQAPPAKRPSTGVRAALARSEGLLEGILQTAMDAVVVCRSDQRIVLFNAAAEGMFRLPRSSALGMPVTDLMPVQDRGGHARLLRQLSARPLAPRAMGRGLSVRGLRADGEEFPVEAAVSVAMNDGQPYFTAIVRDVTERRQEREALVRSNMELKQFASVASHDLRSPLRTIQGFLGLLEIRLGPGVDPRSKELLGRAMKAARHMDELTAALLGYARLEDTAHRMAPLDMAEAVHDAAQLLQDAIDGSSAAVRIGQLPRVRGDMRQLVQLFQNLIGNALKYRGDAAPVISVSARQGNDGWVFSVADNGIGMEGRLLSRIFDIFERLHTQDAYPGTGIGLAICKRIVERHGGRIWADSRPGAGSTFHFTLPDRTVPP